MNSLWPWSSHSRPPSLRVVVADPDPDLTISTEMLLAHFGHQSRCSANGVEALALAKSFLPDVIVASLRLAGIDGFSLARKIRAFEQPPKVVLVALTAHLSEDQGCGAAGAGFDYCWLKPVEPEMLKEFLADIANKRGLPVLHRA